MDRTRRRAERESEDPSEEPARLSALMRAGELRPWQLKLAARLGSRAARIVMDHDEPEEPITDLVLRPGVSGRSGLIRVWCAILRPLLKLYRVKGPAQRTIEAAEAWVACPCADHERSAERAADKTRAGHPTSASPRAWARWSVQTGWDVWWDYDSAVYSLEWLCADLGDLAGARGSARDQRQALRSLVDPAEDHWSLPKVCPESLREALRAELLPWLLAESDPLTDRVWG